MELHTGRCRNRDEHTPRYAFSVYSQPESDNKLGQIPKGTSSPQQIQFKPRASSSDIFIGREDYLAKLKTFFTPQPNEPQRRKKFLLYGMGGIGKTQICLKFIEENSDL
jgi:Holliday junction resolvasome RuvABC ATP-dependent DNA helicase subunit